MLKKQPWGKKKKHMLGHSFPPFSSADDILPPPPPPYTPFLFLRRFGLVVAVKKGNHWTARAWIFQMTNVAHAYFWHIWLPRGNKTLLMQGDHLLSVAGVSKQAEDSARTHTHKYAETRADRTTHFHSAGGVRRQRDACTHTCTNSTIRWELGSKLIQTERFCLKRRKKKGCFFFCQTCCKSQAAGDSECTHYLCFAINTWLCLPGSRRSRVISWWCKGGDGGGGGVNWCMEKQKTLYRGNVALHQQLTLPWVGQNAEVFRCFTTKKQSIQQRGC